MPWAGEILCTPESQDDVKIQNEVDEDDGEKGAPTMEELNAYKQVCKQTRVPLSVGRGGGFYLIGSPCIRWLRMQYE